MSKYFYYIYIIPLFLSAVLSLKAFRLNWPGPYRLLSLFLFLTLFVELTAIFWKDIIYLHKTQWWEFSRNNMWLYNIYFLPQYLFYLVFYKAIIPLKKVKVVISVLIIVYVIFWLINIRYIQGLLVPNNYTLIFGSLIILFLVIGYFYSLLVRNKLIVLHKEPLVWISCGALFYNLGCLPYFIWFNKLVTSSQDRAYAFLIVVVLLNTVMYSLYTIAFLWKKIF